MSEHIPLISVCIPTFNNIQYLPDTVNSVLSQTYKNIEIIIADDGSTDETEAKIKSIRDSRIKFIRQCKKGASSARNLAFKNSKGTFVKFLDADDLLNNEFISEQVAILSERSDCIASACWGRFYNDDESTFTSTPENVWENRNPVDWLIDSLIESGGNMMQPGLFLIPRQIIEKSGLWNEELSLIDDFEFMCRVMLNSAEILFCRNAVLKYRSGNNGSLSSKKQSIHMQSAFRSLELGLGQLLEISNSERARLAAANAFQRWAYQFYPEHPSLFERAQKKVHELGGSTVKPEGGRIFQWLAKWLGWKIATRLMRSVR